MSIERLYLQYFQPLVKYLRATYGEGPPAPEDVAQQAFEKLNTRGDLSSIDNPQGFVWTTARNIALSSLRHKQVQDNYIKTADLFAEQGVEIDPERVYIAKEQIALILAVLKEMPVRRRRIFILNRVHGKKPAEIARQLGLARNAVVRHLAVAMTQIEQAIEQVDDNMEEEQ